MVTLVFLKSQYVSLNLKLTYVMVIFEIIKQTGTGLEISRPHHQAFDSFLKLSKLIIDQKSVPLCSSAE